MESIRVAALQLRAHDRADFSGVWPSIRATIGNAASDGARLIVLPEGTVPGYVLGEQPVEPAIVERAVADLREIARTAKSVIVCGIARTSASHVFNSALTIDSDGTIAGYADKAFLWHFDRRWFSPAERLAPISTSLGKLGVLVCADGRMPMIASELVAAGAELLVMPTAWVTSERDPNNLENIQADLLARVRARENGVPFVAANKCGVERHCVAYCGKSQIVDASGTILAMASQREPEILSATLSNAGSAARSANDLEPHGAITGRRTLRRARGSAGCAQPFKTSFPRANARAGAEHGGAATSFSETDDRAGKLQVVRIAITLKDGSSLDEAMRIVEATQAIACDATRRIEQLDAVVPTILVDDATIADPIGLIPYRRSGYQLVVWEVRDYDADWIVPIARARATELKLYVAVVDRTHNRALAIDPDGAVLTSTTAEYTVASFVLDPARTTHTLVAPGTDIAAGIERIIAITQPA